MDNENQTEDSETLEDLLASIKNHDGEKKYADVTSALIALKHSQQYIPELKEKLTATEAELERLKQMSNENNNEDVADVIRRVLAEQQNPNVMKEEPKETPKESEVGDEQKLGELVRSLMAERDKEQAASSNKDKVLSQAKELFGDEAEDRINEIGKEYGLDLTDIAARSPSLVLDLLNSKASKPASKPGGSDINTTGLTTKTGKISNIDELPKPEKSMLLGASAREQAAEIAKIREVVMRKHGLA